VESLAVRGTLTAQGSWPLTPQTRIGATFRLGSNFPIPGYLASRDDVLVLGATRNLLRLPTYARLDLRAERTSTLAGRPVALFAELINALNHRNVGPAFGTIDQITGRATGFTEPLFPRIASIGLKVGF
jgi:hypothetical protein